ncbi:uncharacterized protein TNCV_3317921 [Trichonephila clavipes]|nr:uncharacterized protein TNCV_3317921 [Trichonephila clavipes]
MVLCPGKGLVLPNSDIDIIATRTRVLILSLPNNEMCTISPFAINKALIGIGGEPKSVKCLRSGDLLIETLTALQTKYFLLVKTFLNSPILISPHKSLNSCRRVISKPDLLTTPEAEILDGFSDQGVTQFTYLESTLPSEDFILPSTSDRVENLSTEILPPVPLFETSPTTSSSQPSFLKVVNKNSKRRRKRMKEQKSDIEIKMSPHKPNKIYVHYTSEDEGTIVFDVKEDESFKHIIQDRYSHFMTPSKYKKK